MSIKRSGNPEDEKEIKDKKEKNKMKFEENPKRIIVADILIR